MASTLPKKSHAVNRRGLSQKTIQGQLLLVHRLCIGEGAERGVLRAHLCLCPQQGREVAVVEEVVAAARPGTSVERVVAAKDTLDGHSCQIEDITVSSPKTGGHLKMRFWEAEDLQGFPVKIEFLRPGGRDAIIRYKNVVLGPQDPTLFIHPKSCQSAPQRGKPKTRKAPRGK